MKVILTSKGFENEKTLNKIKKIINKPFKEIKMLVIPVARKYEYKREKYLTDYIELGFEATNIIFFDDENPDLYRNLNIDLIYICGGNTFLLKKCLKESDFEKDILEYINKRCNVFSCKCWNTYCYS